MKRVLSLALVVCLIVSAFAIIPVSAQTTENGLTYEIKDGKVTIKDCVEDVTEVIIPADIEGYPVTTIGAEAFQNCKSLVSVTIPDTVTVIKHHAFAYCYDLADITIPESVTDIGKSAFSYCQSLKSISIPKGVTAIISTTFHSCKSLESVTFSEGLTSIDYYSFGYTNLRTVTLPASLTRIDNSAFAECSNLESIYVDEDNTAYTSVDGVLFDKMCTKLVRYPNGKKGETYTVPNTVTVIADGAFSDCNNLTTISLPRGITYIANLTFSECGNLTSLVIPNGVKSIGNQALYGCKKLTSVTIPPSVKMMNSTSFENCKNVTIYGLEDSYAHAYAVEHNIPFEAITYQKGDVDMDGKITIKDATAIQKHLVFIEVLEGEVLSLADYDEDGVVTIKDATDIQKLLAGLI